MKNKYSNEIKEQAKKLHEDGKTPLEISKELNGPSKSAIMRWLGLKKKKAKVAPVEEVVEEAATEEDADSE